MTGKRAFFGSEPERDQGTLDFDGQSGKLTVSIVASSPKHTRNARIGKPAQPANDNIK